ncbi:AmmeMemoRadiSam system protein B [Candidatus Parcubacteria bacterium]|nr:MAG: AmmeMemoRadiSam system protein B [Candidatus Parcubacteria bacterium]
MIVFSAFVPHPPIAIPEVGKENLDKLSDTIKAYQTLEHEIYSAKPDTIILISSHAEQREEAFAVNQAPDFKVNFKKFGDLVTNLQFKNDIGFGYQIKELCEDYFPVMMTAQEELDYGSGVPLFYLTQHLPNIKVVSIAYSNLSSEDHFKFGQIIRKQINLAGKRVAVIASGDLSHKLHKDSPAGYSARGQEFDQKIIKALAEKKVDDVIHLDPELVKEAGECGHRALLVLLGVIDELNYEHRQLSYQSPFGIGYLVTNFEIK